MRKVVFCMLISATVAYGQETQPSDGTRVTLQQCIQSALEKNLQIRVDSYTPRVADTMVNSADSVFDPTFKANVQDYGAKNRTTRSYDPTAVNQATYNFTLGQVLLNGSNYQISFNNTRTTNNSIVATISPAYDSALQFQFTQPLLRNLGSKIARANILIAMKSREASEQQFRASVSDVINQVQTSYWNLVYSLSNLEVQRQSLKLAQDLLGQNRVRVQVGTLAPIDLLQSEAEVATREEGILVAEADVQNNEDALKRLMNLPGDSQDWSAKIVPADTAVVVQRDVRDEEMLKMAIEKRPELVQLRRDLEGKGINLNYTRNQLKPDLSVFVQAATTGVGGNVFIFEGQKKIGEIPGGYGDAVSELWHFKYPNWAFGFTFTLPIHNVSAKAAYEKANLESLQAQLRIKALEQQVYQDVRTAVRQVDTNRKRVDATRAALRLAEKKLEAEQKKYSVGLSTNYFVLQFQKDLTQAQTNELRAVTDYTLALVNLDRATGTMLEKNNVEIGGYLK